MPKQLKRYYGGTDLHFITFSCYHRQPNLNTPDRKNVFLEVLEQVRQRYRFAVFGYVVMPEHVHLLLGEPKTGNLSVVIQVLKQTLSRKASPPNKERSEAFWQRRFYDFNVFAEQKLTEKLRYMHRNPVIRGLVEKPEHWQWSSFRHYGCGDSGPVEIDSGWMRQWEPDPTLRKCAKDGAPPNRVGVRIKMSEKMDHPSDGLSCFEWVRYSGVPHPWLLKGAMMNMDTRSVSV